MIQAISRNTKDLLANAQSTRGYKKLIKLKIDRKYITKEKLMDTE